MEAMKPICFLGDSLRRMKDFPVSVRQEAGHNLNAVQHGELPADFKSMPVIGPGVYEIRLRDDSGAFRVFYAVNQPEAVYVLHAFQKKTQATPRQDIELGRKRYKELLCIASIAAKMVNPNSPLKNHLFHSGTPTRAVPTMAVPHSSLH